MSCTLILMRHAKSDWDDPLLSDHDRRLNKRGRGAAKTLGNWLTTHDLRPDEALVSSAVRTQETWELLQLRTTHMRTHEELYLASSDRMLQMLGKATAATVLMIAHNPGIADLANRLVTQPPAHPRFIDYPSGATTVLTFPIERWELLTPGTGAVLEFVVPRELAAI